MSFAFAHMDYRQREERFARLRDQRSPLATPFDRTNLNYAIGFGIASAMAGAAALGGFAMLFVPERHTNARG